MREGHGNHVAALTRRNGIICFEAAYGFDQTGECLAFRSSVIRFKQMPRLFQRVGWGCAAELVLCGIAMLGCRLRAGKRRADYQRKEINS